MKELSIFAAADEAPARTALVEGERAFSFRELAERTAPRADALARLAPAALALTPRADLDSLLWLYAAFATLTPVLTLHARATAADAHSARLRANAATLDDLQPLLRPTPLGDLARAWDGPSDERRALAFIPTSGSTGTPRLVELSRGAVLASARASEQNLGWEPDERWLLCLPLAHAGGLMIVLRCLIARRCVLLFEPGPQGLLSQVPELVRAAESATLLSLVPSLLAALLDAGFVGQPSLRAVLVGGAGCAPALAERARAAGLPLLTTYGLTETASQVVTRPYQERFAPLPVREGVVSSGRPLSGVELELRGGLIAVRTPSLFSGYCGEAGAHPSVDGFFTTADRGELLDGELYVRGRSDDLIVTGGENVDPLEVEAALLSLPGVKSAFVFGTPSPRFGEVVTAVVASQDVAHGDVGRLAALLSQRLARHKLPRRALRVATLPLTASGKVDRSAARARYAAAFATTDA